MHYTKFFAFAQVGKCFLRKSAQFPIITATFNKDI